jgi:hypothetical protein
MKNPPELIESESIMAELNPEIAAKIVESLLQSPEASKGLAKLLMAISAIRFMSGSVNKEDPDPFIEAAAIVIYLRQEWLNHQAKKGKK